jgi:DNA-binding MarR family transcriptional regulator
VLTVEHEESLDRLVEVWLENFDCSLLADWDVLVFLYRHRATLASAEQISCLVGYTSTVVGDALDRLESRRMVKRSRASQGVRLYQLLDSTAPSDDSFQQLMSLAENRTGRLLLAKKLRQLASRQQERDRDGLHLVVKGSATWPKAV